MGIPITKIRQGGTNLGTWEHQKLSASHNCTPLKLAHENKKIDPVLLPGFILLIKKMLSKFEEI